MSQIQERTQKIIKEFSQLSNWEERYKKIIQIGKDCPALDKKYKTSKWLVKGCQSQVWLHVYHKEGKLFFEADSDALITKGLVALLLQYYSGLSPEEIKSTPVPNFFDKLDLKNHLTPTRVGGLFSMLKQIQYYAQAFSVL